MFILKSEILDFCFSHLSMFNSHCRKIYGKFSLQSVVTVKKCIFIKIHTFELSVFLHKLNLLANVRSAG